MNTLQILTGCFVLSCQLVFVPPYLPQPPFWILLPLMVI
ncbi:Uncharacterised protein [Kluyvera cryocrescens]|uniref:Uncharacterized protein n=1 Tax=Kluyvera cryocrescens TaxID=580 RepID=A0A485BNJ0_KLUCR|nr:Uncharacterised protein [Kluyvera cryocrescens]